MRRPERTTVFDLVADFGLVGDGSADNTGALTRAFATAELEVARQMILGGAARAGDETLFAQDLLLNGRSLGVELWIKEPGVYLTGPFNLTSHTTFALGPGVTIKAHDDRERFPLIEPLPSYGRGRDFAGPRRAPFLGAFGLKDVAIVRKTSIEGDNAGNATFDGSGYQWWKDFLACKHKNGPICENRPHLMEFHSCDGVLLDGITLKNSPFWTVHPIYSSNVVARGRTVHPIYSSNVVARGRVQLTVHPIYSSNVWSREVGVAGARRGICSSFHAEDADGSSFFFTLLH